MQFDHQSIGNFQLPSLPVIFDKRLSQQVHLQQKYSFLINNSPIKFEQQQIDNLKNLIRYKYQNEYSFLFTQQLSRISIQNFLEKYQAFNKQFIQQFHLNMHNYQIIRLGANKVYVGNLQASKCSGKGILIFKNGNIYQGEMKQNKRQGKGTFFEANIGWYKGIFHNDIKQGHGIEVYINKAAYKGNFVNGLRQNLGIYTDIHENEYSGEWKLGIIHGKGILKTKQSIYQGTFVNWLKHGQGVEKFLSGDIYKGQYQNNRFDGFGSYQWSNEAIYEGNFRNNFRHGKGKWCLRQTKYLGNYVQGQKQGYGQIYYPNGNFYKGNFLKDKRQGYGEMFWTDGSFYKGQWKNGIQHGKGQIYLAGGQIIVGVFQNSILVEQIQSNLEKETEQNFGLVSSQPRGILVSRGRTFSDNKKLNYRKKLVQIDESLKKPNHSTVKTKLYFKSPEKSDRSTSKGNASTGQRGSHHHDGRQCKCLKRLQNFRLKQKLRTKINDSRLNIMEIQSSNMKN